MFTATAVKFTILDSVVVLLYHLILEFKKSLSLSLGLILASPWATTDGVILFTCGTRQQSAMVTVSPTHASPAVLTNQM